MNWSVTAYSYAARWQRSGRDVDLIEVRWVDRRGRTRREVGEAGVVAGHCKGIWRRDFDAYVLAETASVHLVPSAPPADVVDGYVTDDAKARQTEEQLARLKAQNSEKPAPLRNGPEKVQIVASSDLYVTRDEAARSLENHPDVYQRAGKLARVTTIGDTRSKAKTKEGTPQILPMCDATLATELAGRWSWTKKRRTSRVPPDKVVAALQKLGRWPVRTSQA